MEASQNIKVSEKWRKVGSGQYANETLNWVEKKVGQMNTIHDYNSFIMSFPSKASSVPIPNDIEDCWRLPPYIQNWWKHPAAKQP